MIRDLDLGQPNSELGQTNSKLGRISSGPNQNYCYTHIFSCMEIKNIIKHVTVIYQGCVERGNGDLQLKLGKWLDQHGGTWSTALQLVTHAINTSTAAATGKTILNWSSPDQNSDLGRPKSEF